MPEGVDMRGAPNLLTDTLSTCPIPSSITSLTRVWSDRKMGRNQAGCPSRNDGAAEFGRKSFASLAGVVEDSAVVRYSRSSGRRIGMLLHRGRSPSTTCRCI